MKTSLKVASGIFYLICAVALFLPYHIDDLSQISISAVDCMFGYMKHDTEIRGQQLLALVFILPLVSGFIINLFGRVGGMGSLGCVFVGFGMSLFNFFMRHSEATKGATLSMICYFAVFLIGMTGLVFLRDKRAVAAVKTPAERPRRRAAQPQAEEPSPKVSFDFLEGTDEYIDNSVSAGNSRRTVDISSVDAFYNSVKAPEKPEVNYRRSDDFDYFLQKYKEQHKDD